MRPRPWDELACRSPRGEALQSVAWGDVKQASGWVPRRYRIDDEHGSGRGRVHPGTRPDGARHPAHTGVHPGTGAGRRRVARALPVRAPRPGAAARGRAARPTRRCVACASSPASAMRRCWSSTPAGTCSARRRRRSGPAGFVPARRPVQVSTTGMFVPLHADEDAQWRQLNQNARRNVDKCRKAGVEVVRFDQQTDPAS